ncbi:hypothetical protein ACQSSU_06545 [Micromonospora echinospora]
MTKTTYTTDCECCGRPGARLVIVPGGGFAELREDCLADAERQAELDALCALR